MKNALKFGLLLGTILSASPANAEPVKAVVELFTSQSCSSCPPADRLFGEIVEKGGVVGLAWHVDYWNYLDWKDTYSMAGATDRQYAYAKAFGSTQVYTPQFILNGRTSIQPDNLESAIAAQPAGKAFPVEVTAATDAERMVIKAGAGTGEANLIVVQFEDEKTVNVASGENSGKVITNNYAVTGVHTVGMWSGQPLQVNLPVREYMPEKGRGCAVLLQRMKDNVPGEIIGAAMISWK